MDEILPLFIYVVSLTKIDNFCSEIRFIEDFLKSYNQAEFEMHEKMLTNIIGGVDYVKTFWEIPKME